MTNINLPIGGFLKQSLIDYPGNISTVLFIKGCNFRCFYCHNPELVLPDLMTLQPDIDLNIVLQWLKENSLLLDAVVITGGEPTLYPDLIKFLDLIKKIPLKIKIDTNGTNPLMISNIINNKLIDYIAIDIKAPLKIDKYKQIVGETINDEILENIKKTIKIVEESNIDFEFRTTINGLLSNEDLQEIIQSIKGKYFIQSLKIAEKLIDKEKTIKFSKNPSDYKISDYAFNGLKIQLR